MTIYDPIADALGLEPIELENSPSSEYIILDSNISRKEAISRNKELLTCDICGVTGGGTNMLRWHFENCKNKIKKCEQCEKDIPIQGLKPYLYKQKKYCNRDCYMKSKRGSPPIEMTQEVRKKISDARKSFFGKGK